LLLKDLIPTSEGVDLGDEFLLALNGESLRSAFQERFPLFSLFLENSYGLLLSFLNEQFDLAVVIFESTLDQIKVFIETIFQLSQAFVNL